MLVYMGNARLKFINQLGGEENVLPIESIKDESVTSKNKTAKNRPPLEEKGALVGVSPYKVCEVITILSRYHLQTTEVSKLEEKEPIHLFKQCSILIVHRVSLGTGHCKCLVLRHCMGWARGMTSSGRHR